MGQILEAELIIKGSDKTGAAFAGVIAHAQELKKTLSGLQGMRIGGADFAAANTAIREQTTLLNSELRAVQAINRATALGNEQLVARTGLLTRMRQRMEGMTAGMGMYGWMAGGYMAGRTARALAHDTGEFEHQKAMLATTSGMTAAEVERAVSGAMAARIPTMSAAANLKAIGELRMVFGSTEHALENFTAVQRAAAMMKAVNPHMEGADDEAYQMARALEIKGVSMDPAHFNRLNSMMVQAVNASRGKVTGTGFFEFTQYARGAARYLSDDFYTRVAPTIIQEMRPTSAGRGISSLYQQVIAGKMSNKAAEEWVKLGLVKPEAVIWNKVGTVKGVRPGGFVDAAGFMSDPYAWIQKYLAPALKKHGITDEAKVGEEIAHLFSNQFAAQMAQILLTQKDRIEKDWGLIAGAPSTEALESLREADPKAALSDLGAGLNSLLGALGSPLAGGASFIMNKLADGARSLASGMASLAKTDPFAAKALSFGAVGGLGYVGLKGMQSMFGLFTGSTALKGSAAALTQAAGALDAAAVRLGAAGAAGAAANAAGASGFLRAALPFLSFGLPLIGAGAYGTWRGAEWTREEIAKNPNLFAEPSIPSPMGLSQYGFVGSIPDLSSAAGAINAATPQAELTGNAEISNKITVTPSPEFYTTIETMISNAIRGIHIDGAPPEGSSGSTGRSMPEVAPGFGG